MLRWIRPGLVVAAAALIITAMAACDSTPPTTPTQPAPTVTESFSGSLTQNGTTIFQFTIKAAGPVTATVKSLAPDSAAVIGVGLGNWLGTACGLVVDSAAATQGTVVTGTVATATAPNLCLRVNDAAGTITDPVTFTIEVVHP